MEFDLVDFFCKHLAQGYAEDDVVLEIVILVGTIVNDRKSATLIKNSEIITSLVDLLLRE